ncbi:MAG: DUF262 domain-containing HNH endonuclease family protein [Cryomorphaceae bacterium]|nr:DUF262 domain-containing HNH endonuclease family protein [Cryomorphaceae bacterium]
MEKKTLSNILEGKIFQIPDYQRGYAWEAKQWKDFVQDIDALIDDKIISHYTGTIVIYQPIDKPTENYGTKKLEIVDVVDGQQRLTTCSLYLSIILRELINISKEDYTTEIPIYLHSGSKSKLRLNNDTADFYLDLVSKGVSNIEPNSVHQNRIYEAFCFLKMHVEEQLRVYRNIQDVSEKEDFTKTINKTWKEVYVNIAQCNGSESQCLRVAWTLFVNYTPKNWDGYSGFKSDEVIPLRNFSVKSKEEVKSFLLKFVDGLALISKHYSTILKSNNAFDENELNLLTKIRNAGNIANYLPLMVASRIKRENNVALNEEYIGLLKSLEMFSYRVFLWEGIRSNAGLSKFYRWADDVFTSKHSLQSVTEWIYGTINWYSPENAFRKSLTEDFFEWYQHRRLLKYTLFEFELFLLKGKNKPKLNWEDLSDSTIEHILPQNPDANSNWISKWTAEERNKFTHDISNLVLTKDNSRYSNFEFERKKGVAGSGYSYSNSDIRQERKIAEFDDWTNENRIKRRNELIGWIIGNWGVDSHFQAITEDIIEDEEEPIFNDID